MVISQYIVGIIGVTVGGDRGDQTNKAAVAAMIAFICINISMFAATWGVSDLFSFFGRPSSGL